MDWQPIETAPKDGTWVLLLIPESVQDSSRPKPWVEAAQWVDEFHEVWEQISPDRKERRIRDRSHWSCYEDPTGWAPMPSQASLSDGQNGVNIRFKAATNE